MPKSEKLLTVPKAPSLFGAISRYSVVGAKVFRVRATAVSPRLSPFFGPSFAFVDISWHIRHQREREILYNVAQKQRCTMYTPCVRTV